MLGTGDVFMLGNIHNEFQLLSSQHAILVALENLQPKKFKNIQSAAKVSSKTMSKHLGNLVAQGLVEKEDRKYRITSMGLEHLGHLAQQLRKYNRYRTRIASLNTKRLLRHDAIEVTGTGPSGACVGIVHVSLPRRLRLQERSKIDHALTETIHIIARCLPKDSKRYDVTINGTLK